VLPVTTFGVELNNVDGIWQNTSQENSFYSITQDGNAIVLIDLKRLEAGGNTLAATYIGPLNDLLLTPLAPFPTSPFDQIPLRINFLSEDEATLLPECDTCASPGGTLIKIFK